MLKSQKKFTSARIYLVILYLFFQITKSDSSRIRYSLMMIILLVIIECMYLSRQQSEHMINKNVKNVLR
jgi:hypothetical protein